MYIEIQVQCINILANYQELAKQIDDYSATYEPDDQLEWSLVLSEIKSFIEVGDMLSLDVLYN